MKTFILKKISNKERFQFKKALNERNPFIEIGLKYDKARNIWFQFIEQITLTGFLIYVYQKTHNIAVGILVIISAFIWFLKILAYTLIFQRLLAGLILIKSKFWWQLLILVLIVSVLLIYLMNSFIEMFKVIH